MKYNTLTRRYFLQGLGGSLLALPILPSLLPKAHAELPIDPRFLVFIGTPHGGTGETDDWYPQPVVNNLTSNLLNVKNLFASQPSSEIPHQYREGLLKSLLTANPGHPGGNVDMGKERLSFILGQFLNPYLDHMNLYRGIDAGTFYSGHNLGLTAGNIKMARNNPTAAEAMEHWPTIDQFLASSTKFYKPNEDISNKIFYVGGGPVCSFLADGSSAGATDHRIDRLYNALFSKYEKNVDSQLQAEKLRKTYLIDRVREDYLRLTKGAFGPARSLSSVDKQRVEQHAELLFDTQKKYHNIINSCSDVTGPNQPLSVYTPPVGVSKLAHAQNVFDLTTDLMAAAFNCGATRIGILNPNTPTDFTGDYHTEIAHQLEGSPEKQLIHNKMFRWTAEHVVAKIVSKIANLNVAGTSKSILDHSLVLWTHECGYTTHHHNSLGVISLGSFGGFFQTGKYLDYRNINNMGLQTYKASNARPGMPIQRLWANIIQGAGFSPSEYERNGRPGYSDSSINEFPKGSPNLNLNHIAYPKTMMDSLSERIPGLSA